MGKVWKIEACITKFHTRTLYEGSISCDYVEKRENQMQGKEILGNNGKSMAEGWQASKNFTHTVSLHIYSYFLTHINKVDPVAMLRREGKPLTEGRC
jgi:hypothetical protein